MMVKQLNIFDMLERDPGKNYLTDDHFNLATRNPRFVYWLLTEGKQAGDEYRMYEYIIWNSQRVREFKVMNGFQESTPNSHIPDFHEGLDAYMRGFVKQLDTKV